MGRQDCVFSLRVRRHRQRRDGCSIALYLRHDAGRGDVRDVDRSGMERRQEVESVWCHGDGSAGVGRPQGRGGGAVSAGCERWSAWTGMHSRSLEVHGDGEH